tara:strand:+ start:419 stop:607 length:189 start_codon:yes stop_codon:yes gene_type:complete
MKNSSFCSSTSNEKIRFFQQRKLRMLLMMKDAIERRLAAITATIDTLQSQIDRNSESETITE